MTPTLVPHDAISNDVRGMARALRRSGYRVEVYAKYIHPDLSCEAQPLQTRTDSFWRDERTLLIYHHSMGWSEGQAVVLEAHCRLVIRYHNVTPARFFEPYSADHTAECATGEQATRQLITQEDALFWAASRFNAEDLIQYGARREHCRVLSPFHCTKELANAPIALDVVHICKQHTGLKILFVGGMKPNKGHVRLIRALATFRRYADPDAVLILPGTSDPRLKGYTDVLRRVAAQLGVEAGVVFAGTVEAAQLRAYYFSADVFLCLSEHEGFCVPLLEAMHFRIPIIAHRCTAIPETVGCAGLLWEQDDLDCIVESLALCLERDDRYRALTDSGWELYSTHYSEQRIEEKFLSLLQEALNHGPA